MGFIHKLDSSVQVMIYQRHNKPINENIIFGSKLIKKLSKNGWTFKNSSKPNIYHSLNKYYSKLTFVK